MRASMTPRTWNPNITLIAGVAGGLLIGLLIGWVLWPVQWQGATLNELFPDAKAHYLSAVAEAYTLYDSPEAAATAQQRLATFGANLSQEIEGAIAYYSNSNEPDKEIRISNLTRMAQALGVFTPNLVGLTQSDDAPPDEAPLSQESATTEESTPAETDAGIGWARWLIYLLLAVMLVLVGVYLLLRNRTDGDAQLNEMIDDRIGALNEKGGAWLERVRSYVSPTPVAKAEEEESPSTAPWRPIAAPTLPPNEQEGYGFDEDPDEPATERNYPDRSNRGQASHFSRVQLNDIDAYDIDEEETDDADLDSDLDDPFDASEDAKNAFNHASGFNAPYRAVKDQANRQEPDASAAPESWINHSESPLASGGLGAQRNEPALRSSAFSSRNAKYKLLEVYTAEYQMGMRDYDEATSITDPQTNKYIGECGMGTSAKNGLLQNNSDHVVALEVWLFDKTDERNIGSQTRVLLSEYAIDHNLDQAFLKERQDDPRPFTAQPNVQFDLESQNLLLKCIIVEAEYISTGPAKGTFQSVKVEMHVHKKV